MRGGWGRGQRYREFRGRPAPRIVPCTALHVIESADQLIGRGWIAHMNHAGGLFETVATSQQK